LPHILANRALILNNPVNDSTRESEKILKILNTGSKKVRNTLCNRRRTASLKLSVANSIRDRGSESGLNIGAANMKNGSFLYFDQFAIISSRFMYDAKNTRPKKRVIVKLRNPHILELGT
jgi:hypothetical protein